jgi:hypothetical protein
MMWVLVQLNNTAKSTSNHFRQLIFITCTSHQLAPNEELTRPEIWLLDVRHFPGIKDIASKHVSATGTDHPTQLMR